MTAAPSPPSARRDSGPMPVRMDAADARVTLGGLLWRHGGMRTRPVVVIAPATSVACRYYTRFADDLFAHGFDVLAFDYRGIGLSRPAVMRGFSADWVDWGESDLEAALRHAARLFPDRPVHVVAHSIGGFAVGLAPSNGTIGRVLTVGAQFAHWRDYAVSRRRAMFAKWHLLMPALTAIFGYLPARRLGWMEDTPAGVVRDWSTMRPRFEDSIGRSRVRENWQAAALAARFRQVTAPILAVGIEDDPFGTVAAVDRLLAYFTASERMHLRIAPADIAHESIGHFAFFHDRFRDTLWPLARAWLATGTLPMHPPGRVVRTWRAAARTTLRHEPRNEDTPNSKESDL